MVLLPIFYFDYLILSNKKSIYFEDETVKSFLNKTYFDKTQPTGHIKLGLTRVHLEEVDVCVFHQQRIKQYAICR